MRRMTPSTGALVVAAGFRAAAISGTKYALGGFGAITLLRVELVAAAVALWLFAVVRGRRSLVAWRYAIALGLLEPCLAYLGETLGLRRTSAANASVIGGLEAAFVVLLAAIFLRGRITGAVCCAVVVGLLGVVVLEQGHGLTGLGVVEARTSAVILNLIPVFGLVCAVAWLGERLTPDRLVGAGLITASVAVFGWVELRPAHEPHAPTVIAEEMSWQRA